MGLTPQTHPRWGGGHPLPTPHPLRRLVARPQSKNLKRGSEILIGCLHSLPHEPKNN